MGGSPQDPTSRRAYLSRALKAVRRRRGLSAAEMARAVGMPLRSYQHFEAGRTRINTDRVHEIARILNADPYAILAAVDLGSPEFAVRAADNKLMTIILMALRDFDATAADLIAQLDARILTTTFERVFLDLAAQARERAAMGDRWRDPHGSEDPDTD
jgi:transcriptional regulator with XRE-family HTH domain